MLSKRFVSYLISIIIFIISFEIGVRIFQLDVAALFVNRSVVGFGHLISQDIHRSSDNSNRLIELIPNIKVKFGENLISPYEKKYKEYNVSINSLGFRGAEFKQEKKEGVFRVFFIGGSNTFGMVDDEDTYTAQLQKLLNKKYPGKFEIINAGLSGTVFSQYAFWADEIVNNYSPDLLVFQKTNIGRRPFVVEDPNFSEHFKKNPELFRENIPDSISDSDQPTNLHYKLVDIFASYRLFLSVNATLKWRSNCFGKKYTNSIKNCFYYDGSNNKKFESYAEHISNREFNRFVSANHHIPIVVFYPLLENCYFGKSEINPHIYTFNFCNHPKDPEYRDLHPPSYVYTWYAEQLAPVVFNFYEKK